LWICALCHLFGLIPFDWRTFRMAISTGLRNAVAVGRQGKFTGPWLLHNDLYQFNSDEYS